MTNINKTLKERELKYGSFKQNAHITQSLCDVLKDAPNYDTLSKQHIECFHMIFHKISRLVCGDTNHTDSIHDIVGYAKLLEDYINNETVNKSDNNKFCNNCDNDLKEMSISYDNNNYCSYECFKSKEYLNKTKCYKCNKNIEKSVISYDNKSYCSYQCFINK